MTEPARRFPVSDDPGASEDPFRLGSRWIRVRRPDGTWERKEIPLTAMDLLDPQEGDLVVQNTWHANTVFDIFSALKWRYEPHPDILVGTDLKMLWGIRGLQNPAPDVAVIPRVRDREKLRSSFDVLLEGTRPILVLEVVSDDTPEHQDNDHDKKVTIYQRAGVREYLILDPPARTCHPHWTGYRLDLSRRYQPIAPDEEGRIFSETTGLWFGIDPDRRTLRIVDAMTDERLPLGNELRERLQGAEAQAGREAEARRTAETQARREAEARRAAEAEVARLREEIERLKGGSNR